MEIVAMPVAPDPTRVGHFKRFLAVMTFAGIAYSSLLCSPAIASQLSSQFGYDAVQIGLYFSMEYGGYVLAGVIGQWAMPRYAWRRITAMALLGFVIGTIASTTVLGDFKLLLAVRAPTATCGTLLGVAAMASANEDRHSSRAMSLFIMGQLVAGIIGLAILPILFRHYGLASYFLAVAILALGLLRIIRWLADGKGQEPPAQVATKATHSQALMLGFPAVLLFYVALGGTWTFAGAIGSQAGLDAVASGRILSAATVAGLIGAATASLLGRSANPRGPVGVGYALLVGGGLLLLDSAHLWAYLTAILWFKFAWTFVIPFVFAIIGQHDLDGRVVSGINIVAGIGLATGPYLAGQIVASLQSYSLLLLVESTLLAFSGIFVLMLAGKARRSQRLSADSAV